VIDALMMFTIFSGFVFCGAYFRSQYLDWRQQQTSYVKEKLRVRLLDQLELSRPQKTGDVGVGVDVGDGGLAESTANPGPRSQSDRYTVIAQANPLPTAPIPPRIMRFKHDSVLARRTSR
jgi:hypothetical protein